MEALRNGMIDVESGTIRLQDNVCCNRVTVVLFKSCFVINS